MKKYIPREWLFGHPEKTLTKLSPDGQYISYLEPYSQNLRLAVESLDKKNNKDPKITLQTNSEKYSIEDYVWAYTHHHIIYWHDEQGDENWALFSINIISQKKVRLTPPKTQAKIIKLSLEHPNQIAVLLNNRNRSIFDVCVIHIESGELVLGYENKEYIDIYVDDHFQPKIGIKPNSDGSCRVDCISNNQSKPLTTLSQLDFLGHYMFKENRIGLNKKGDAVFLAQSIETDKAQLVRFDLTDFSQIVLAQNLTSDYQDVILDIKTREPIAVAFNFHIKKWQVINQSYSADINQLISYKPNHEFSVLSQTQDNSIWLIAYHSDTSVPEYYIYYPQNKVLNFVFSSDNRFKANYIALSQQHCLSIPMPDKLEIPCYFSLPHAVAQQSEHTVPLIVWVHGGPNSRDFWGFNPIHQWLTNRGYAVLSVNFRGSTGYGRTFLEAGNGEWGGKIAEDIKTCAEWVSCKYTIINKNKIAIMGRSFGGYSALIGLAKYPDFYACGADWVGPTNLDNFLNYIPPYWKIVYDMLVKMVGAEQSKRLSHSPVQLVHQIKKPILKAHGAHDVRVNQNGPDAFIEKLAKYLPDLWYATFPDEGHRFIHAKNKIAFYALVEAFSAKYLGGGLEGPIQGEIDASSIVFHHGDVQALINNPILHLGQE